MRRSAGRRTRQWTGSKDHSERRASARRRHRGPCTASRRSDRGVGAGRCVDLRRACERTRKMRPPSGTMISMRRAPPRALLYCIALLSRTRHAHRLLRARPASNIGRRNFWRGTRACRVQATGYSPWGRGAWMWRSGWWTRIVVRARLKLHAPGWCVDGLERCARRIRNGVADIRRHQAQSLRRGECKTDGVPIRRAVGNALSIPTMFARGQHDDLRVAERGRRQGSDERVGANGIAEHAWRRRSGPCTESRQ
jgi:hypothetical protein